MSLSKDFMREQFMKRNKINEQPIEIREETKMLFSKNVHLGYFPTLEEAESLDIEREDGNEK